MGAGFAMDEETELARREYGEVYALLKFPTPGEACRADAERRDILEALSERVAIGFSGTKLDCRDLSPGCRLCGEGAWSCLFINNTCNARCFYCPVPQTSRAEPMSGGIRFPNSQEYTAYLEKLGIDGVGISGGEPLVTFERTLQFAGAVKRRFGGGIYLWLYTNGIALTPERVGALRRAGLDEIRFDISADDYRLDKIAMSSGVIPTVTVEIPSIPEDSDRLRSTLPVLAEMGVRHLNLRQIRCTPHNARNLLGRGYTFLHGSKVTVLDSELAALATLRYACDRGIELPIHYCSYAFRERFQPAGQRKRLARFLKKPFEDITPLGYIRRICLRADAPAIAGVAAGFRRLDPEMEQWAITRENTRLFFNHSLFVSAGVSPCTLSVSYWEPVLLPEVSYRNAFVELPLSRKKTLFVERRQLVKDRDLTGEEAGTFLRLLGATSGGPTETELGGFPVSVDGPADPSVRAMGDVNRYELPDRGLQPYA